MLSHAIKNLNLALFSVLLDYHILAGLWFALAIGEVVFWATEPERRWSRRPA